MKNDLYDAIQDERNYQIKKWGTTKEHPHTVMEYISIMEGELQEAKQGWLKGNGDRKALEEVLQVVSVGVACMEQHGIVTRFD